MDLCIESEEAGKENSGNHYCYQAFYIAATTRRREDSSRGPAETQSILGLGWALGKRSQCQVALASSVRRATCSTQPKLGSIGGPGSAYPCGQSDMMCVSIRRHCGLRNPGLCSVRSMRSRWQFDGAPSPSGWAFTKRPSRMTLRLECDVHRIGALTVRHSISWVFLCVRAQQLVAVMHRQRILW